MRRILFDVLFFAALFFGATATFAQNRDHREQIELQSLMKAMHTHVTEQLAKTAGLQPKYELYPDCYYLDEWFPDVFGLHDGSEFRRSTPVMSVRKALEGSEANARTICPPANRNDEQATSTSPLWPGCREGLSVGFMYPVFDRRFSRARMGLSIGHTSDCSRPTGGFAIGYVIRLSKHNGQWRVTSSQVRAVT